MLLNIYKQPKYKQYVMLAASNRSYYTFMNLPFTVHRVILVFSLILHKIFSYFIYYYFYMVLTINIIHERYVPSQSSLSSLIFHTFCHFCIWFFVEWQCFLFTLKYFPFLDIFMGSMCFGRRQTRIGYKHCMSRM